MTDYPFIANIYDKSGKTIQEIHASALKDEEIPQIKFVNIHSIKNGSKFTSDTLSGKIAYIESSWNNNEMLNSIADYFTEPIRIKCRIKYYISPLEYWTKNKTFLTKQFSDIVQLRDYIYNNTKVCTNFNTANSLCILRFFKAKKWLDMSAGWGDRLVSAISHNIDRYVGIDPNPELYDKYKQIVEKLDPANKSKYTFILSGFETAKLPKEKFDLVFTSPPFFDFETYSSSKQDSYNQYKNEKDWYEKFLLVSVKKAITVMAKNGHMVIYISPIYGQKLVQDVKLDYLGSIFLKKDKTILTNIQYYVWKKSV